jgi:hypothetical protein
MARPKKIGLDYFPVDVSFNEQVQALESVHGNNGLVWIIKFWQSAYKTEFGEVDLRGLFGDISANNARTTPEQQKKIISDCLQLGLLIEISDGVYSSNGIKKRICQVSKERENALNRRKNELFVEKPPNNPQTTGESKVKESKVKKSKEKKDSNTAKHLFADSKYFDITVLIEKLGWSEAKTRHYWNSAKNGSEANGYKYLDWSAAIRNWASMDEQRGKPFIEPQPKTEDNQGMTLYPKGTKFHPETKSPVPPAFHGAIDIPERCMP